MGVALMLVLAVLLLCTPAAAQETVDTSQPGWYNGLPIAQVTLEAPRGGLPDDSLETLLRAKQGDKLTPQTIRLDVSTLYGVGDYRSVQANVTPWFQVDIEGVYHDAVLVEYYVYPAPRLVSIDIEGRERLKSRHIHEVVGLYNGDPWYPEVQAPVIEQRLESWMEREGFPEGQAELQTAEIAPDQFALTVRISEGRPTIVAEVQVQFTQKVQDIERFDDAVATWAAKAGVREGKPLRINALEEATELIRRELGQIKEWPFRAQRGWIESQVVPVVDANENKELLVRFVIHPRKRLFIEVEDLAWFRSRTKVIEALGIDERTRITPGFMEEADDKIIEFMQEDGHYKATADVTLGPRERVRTLFRTVEPSPATHELRVKAKKGAQYFALLRFSVDGQKLDSKAAMRRHHREERRALREAEGAHAARVRRHSQREERAAAEPTFEQIRQYKALMKQASPEVLRRGFFTEREVKKGASALRQRLIKLGYQDARVAVPQEYTDADFSDVGLAKRFGLAKLAHRWNLPVPQEAVIRIAVERGERTQIDVLRLQDAMTDIAFDIEEQIRELLEIDGHQPTFTWEGDEARFEVSDPETGATHPFSPQKLEELKNQLVRAHRSAGYLDADARVIALRPRENRVDATIDIDPGPKVLLRSVVLKGHRKTRSSFIRRELDLTLGQTLTVDDIDQSRRSLYELGVFRTVDVDHAPKGLVARDLLVSMRERPAWAFELGGGANTDQGIRAIGRAIRRNLLGRAHQLEGQLLLGLPWRSSSFTNWVPDYEDPDGRIAIAYTAPRFPLRAQTSVVDLLIRERLQERTWQMDRTGAGASLKTSLSRPRQTISDDRLTFPSTDFTTSARIEARRLLEVDSGALLTGEPWTADGFIDVSRPNLPSPVRWQETMTALMVHQRTDDPIASARGYAMRVNAQWSPGAEITQNNPNSPFVKSEGRLTFWQPMGRQRREVAATELIRLRISAAGGYGYAYGKNTVLPLEERYRLGGTGQLRGYQRDAVGPRNETTRVSSRALPDKLGPIVDYALRDDPVRYVPTGGDTLAVGVAELSFPMPRLGFSSWEGYDIAVFSDFGNVWHTDSDVTGDPNNPEDNGVIKESEHIGAVPTLRYGVGFGLRLVTPVGPVAIDLGFNPQRIAASGELRRLLVNDWQEPGARLHLTVGQTF